MSADLEKKIAREFGESLNGEFLLPGDKGYDKGRRVWNGMIDRRPAMIAYCEDADDVMKSVNFARTRMDCSRPCAAAGTTLPGNSVCDGGIVIDLSRMKRIEVNAASRSVRAQAGLTWGNSTARPSPGLSPQRAGSSHEQELPD